MVDEGVFPKAGGDIAFASEANRFARAGGIIDSKTNLSAGSATVPVIVGSTVISPGSLTNPCVFNILATTDIAGGNIGNIEFQLSGTDFGQNMDKIGSGTFVSSNFMTKAEGVLSTEFGMMTAYLNGDITNVIKILNGDVNSKSVFPNSGLVVFYKLHHSSAGGDQVIRNVLVWFERSNI